MDYSKAFDLINHELLVSKLEAMGEPADLARWMTSFLLDSHHWVRIGDILSDSGSPNGGVPWVVFPEEHLGPHSSDQWTNHSMSYEQICRSQHYFLQYLAKELFRSYSILQALYASALGITTWKIKASKTHELLIDVAKDKLVLTEHTYWCCGDPEYRQKYWE
jgi:hypothetical protein